jgi:hypothetical protein
VSGEPAERPIIEYRLSRSGRQLLKPVGGPTELTPVMRLLIEYMVHGLPRPNPGWPAIAPGEPLTVEQAADVLRIRRRNARDLIRQPLVEREMAKAVQALRTGATPRAMRRIVGLVDEKGEGAAADRKVQLEAAKTVLGVEATKGASVSVTVNNQTNVSPGYVIDLSERE